MVKRGSLWGEGEGGRVVCRGEGGRQDVLKG